MNNVIFSWKRFWCPRSGVINISDGGYLYNPESEYSHLINTDVVSFDTIAETSCLILLGEPGSGKTEALRNIVKMKVDNSLHIDLRSYGTEDRLIRNLFENPLFTSCMNGERALHLFLDSLDECLLRIEHIAALLSEEFEKYKENPNLNNLYLRIACRTADWSNLLERTLKGLWGSDNLKVMELAPLRKIDVYSAATELKINADRFINEVFEKEVIPLAIKPITLKFLLNLYIRNKAFPSTQKELYLQGCELLCEEANESRVESRNTGSLRAKDRLKIASRIAALMIFSNKYAIWRSINLGDVPEEDLTIGDISGKQLALQKVSLVMSESDIEETLSTGLFTSRGANRFGWAHQTYAEYLAALYVTQNELPITQIMSLIEHPIILDSERRLIPQLHEVTAWLSTMNPKLFQEIIIRDPQVLLRSDISSLLLDDKKLLVSALLQLYDNDKIINMDLDEYFYKLNHPYLEMQIKLYLHDYTRNPVARSAAVRIARACKLTVIQDELLKVSLNKDEDYQVRVQASLALCEFADEETTRMLFPLAKIDAEADSDEELKGATLHALWPRYINAEELFGLLTLPKRRNYTGLYRLFLNFEIVDKLQVKDLPIALNWVLKHTDKEGYDRRIDDLIRGILKKAGDYLDRSDVYEAFISIVRERVQHYDNFEYIKTVIKNDNIRRAIICSLMTTKGEDENNFYLWITNKLVIEEDFSWIIEQLQNESLPRYQKDWICLIRWVFNSSSTKHVELIRKTAEGNQQLYDQFSELFQTIEINSEQAAELRERHSTMKKREDERAEKYHIHPPIQERVSLHLDDFESGNLDAWWKMNLDLGTKENGFVEETDSNIKALSNWSEVDIHIEVRIISAARKYIVNMNIEDSSWFEANTIYMPTISGYRALRLLYEHDNDFLLSLAPIHWEKWTQAILAQYNTSDSNENSVLNNILKLAYGSVPEKIILDLMSLLDKENERYSNVFIIQALSECWDTRLGEAVLRKLSSEILKPESIRSLLNELLKYRIEGAKEYAKSLITPKLLDNEEDRKKAIIATLVLLNHSIAEGWSIIWAHKEYFSDFVKDVVLKLGGVTGANLIKCLSEIELADLYIWLEKRFPYEEDPDHESGTRYTISKRDEIASIKNWVILFLRNKGTIQSYNQIAKLVIEFPEISWLKRTLRESHSITRRNTWKPALPREIIQLVESRQSRLVQSPEHLLEVLVESLKRLEKFLQGITPEVGLLWNELDIKKYRPKSENEFSDYVKNHLERDLKDRGIIINREVEIRRSAGSLPGERTDIHINAVIKEGTEDIFETITVIIEVKGNWHREVFTAMETQLANRYLKEEKCTHGMYLIGWFESLNWDSSDYRRSAIPACGLEGTKEKLRIQAESVATRGIFINTFVMNLNF